MNYFQNSTKEPSDTVTDIFKKLGIKISDTPYHIPSNKLRHNVVPSDVEKQDVVNHIRKAEEEKKNLNDSISVLEASLKHLKDIRDHVDAYIAGQESLLAPIRNLPIEVLQKIFVTTFPIVSLHDTNEYPLLLGHVCCYWRDITLRFPNLWTNISFYTSSSSSTLKGPLKLLQEALTLSKSSPLCITFPRSPITAELPKLYPFIQSLSPHTHRMEKLALNVLTMLELCSTASNTPSFLVLRSMRLNGRPITTDGKSAAIDFDAPLLSDVEFNGFRDEDDLRGLQIPWEQLTRIKSDKFIPTYALSQLKNLEQLVLTFDGNYHLLDEYVFPSLRHLQLLHHNVPSSHLVEKFTAPNLRSLSVSVPLFFTSTAASIGGVVSRFIRRSSCNISTLSLRGLPHDAIETILHHTPGVTELKLTFSEGFETTPNLLRLKSSEGSEEKTLLARLIAMTIIFEYAWERQSLIERLVEIIKSRLPTAPREEGHVSPLKVVNIYSSGLLEPPSLALLDDLKTATKDIREFVIYF